MRWRRQGSATFFDVVRRYVITPVHQRDGTRTTHERDRAARSGAQRKTRGLTRGAHEAHRVIHHLVVDALMTGDLLDAEDRALVQHRLHFDNGNSLPA